MSLRRPPTGTPAGRHPPEEHVNVHPCLSRRQVLAAGGTGLGALALAGCGSGAGIPELTGLGSGDVLVALADIPVDGAYEVAVDGRRVLITQPTAGNVVAFDAECPHQGCTVRATDDGLGCPCHGSHFDLATGGVLYGPATSPLNPVAVVVRGDDVVLA
jgi:nitrite reductase/ring-hydroxylating ferredoxin subunit